MIIPLAVEDRIQNLIHLAHSDGWGDIKQEILNEAQNVENSVLDGLAKPNQGVTLEFLVYCKVQAAVATKLRGLADFPIELAEQLRKELTDKTSQSEEESEVQKLQSEGRVTVPGGNV